MLAKAALLAAAAAALHIAPERSGSGDGSSWSNAGALEDLPAFVAKADGRPIRLRADAGPYRPAGTISLSAGGAPGRPVIIQGVDRSGRPATAEFVGSRAEPYDRKGPAGRELFRLRAGADHLRFSHLTLRNQGVAFRVSGDLSDLAIEHVDAVNVRRFFDTLGAEKGTASVDGLVIRDVTVKGFSKGAIRLQYDTRKVLIEDVLGDSEGQDGDNFAMGVHITGRTHGVVLRRVTMKNNRDTIHDYWNGDGFAAEGGAYDLRFEDTVASGNTDGGYDLKARKVTLVRTLAEGNKRNYRLWQGDGVLDRPVSRAPVKQGGGGSASHFWFGGKRESAGYRIVGARLEDAEGRHAAQFVFETEAPAKVKVVDLQAPSGEDVRRVVVGEGTAKPQIEFDIGKATRAGR